ncbi:MAG: ABC-F family ATP-binding cassette domain-containing protein [Eubacteriales bacterium]|nr:ABC-F family ATP-binding cassette domain-containing protein [Eubacteriales bacterium]
MKLSIQNLTFTYDGSPEPVFEGLTAELDTGWRLGLVGRNGRGKTTLLRLMLGEFAYQGKIELPLQPVYFPFAVPDPEQLVLSVMQDAAPEEPEWRMLREMNLLQLKEDVLYRPFSTLSKGEQTKALLCALFTRQDVYPLIDEPTNHLDLHGRELTASYLRKKDGFLLVSHDRSFLNQCIDHVASINKTGIEVIQGDYDSWQQQFDQRNAYEQKRNEDLKKDISRLTESARRAAQWGADCEKGKFHVAESDVASVDRGYIGARSAAMMKRSQSTVRRRERAAEEKSRLLHDVEKVGELKLTVLKHPKNELIAVENGAVQYGGRTVCDGIRFKLCQGDRVALTGENGCGKSSVLKSLCGLSDVLSGSIHLASGLTISYVPQETDTLKGMLRDYIRARGLNETLLKAILRNMDFSRDQFEKDMELFSQGQKKKVLLAAGLCVPAHLYIWDEPLNYIDVLSRQQVERLILEFEPTLLLVEHDRRFLEHVCNRPEISLQKLNS